MRGQPLRDGEEDGARRILTHSISSILFKYKRRFSTKNTLITLIVGLNLLLEVLENLLYTNYLSLNRPHVCYYRNSNTKSCQKMRTYSILSIERINNKVLATFVFRSRRN